MLHARVYVRGGESTGVGVSDATLLVVISAGAQDGAGVVVVDRVRPVRRRRLSICRV